MLGTIITAFEKLAAIILRRNGYTVPRNIEALEPKYIVQQIEPYLYSERCSDSCKGAVIEVFGMAGGDEAKAALKTFINKQKGIEGKEQLVSDAQEALKKLDEKK
jgi:hypothetical protein